VCGCAAAFQDEAANSLGLKALKIIAGYGWSGTGDQLSVALRKSPFGNRKA